jgi:hypothetical protein
MKTFQTLRDVVMGAIEFHRNAHSLLVSLEKNNTDCRAQLLLSYMQEHRIQIIETLNKFLTHRPMSLLDTWIQYCTDINMNFYFSQFNQTEDMDIDQIVEIGLDMDSELHNLYNDLEEHSEFGQVRDFLQFMRSIEQKEKEMLTIASNSVYDF